MYLGMHFPFKYAIYLDEEDAINLATYLYETSKEKINTFSVTHQSKKYDESVWSNIVAKKFETNHHTENMTKNIEIELVNKALNSIFSQI